MTDVEGLPRRAVLKGLGVAAWAAPTAIALRPLPAAAVSPPPAAGGAPGPPANVPGQHRRRGGPPATTPGRRIRRRRRVGWTRTDW